MKRIKTLLTALILVGSLSLSITSCKSGPKDEDIKANIDKILPEGVTTEVKKGEATLKGEFSDEKIKEEVENEIKSIPGVKTIKDDTSVKPIEISADDTLKQKITDILKNYMGVSASIQDGVVTLTGQLNRADLSQLMIDINSLQPRKIVNKLVLK